MLINVNKMNMFLKRRNVLWIDSVSRKMGLIVFLLQINIVCLAQEDIKINKINTENNRPRHHGSILSSPEEESVDSRTLVASTSTSLKHPPSTDSFNDKTNLQRLNVISDGGSVGISHRNSHSFLNMYLNQNAPPLVLPQVDYSYSVQRQRNVSFYAPKHNPNEYTIGGVLSGKDGIDHHFIQTLNDLEMQKFTSRNVTLNNAIQNMDTNPIKTAITVCNNLIHRKVYAIIVSKPRQGDLSPASVSYTAGFYHIPVIGISSRDSAFSDKNIHISFLRTLPPYSHQADVWVEMLKNLKYRQLVFIHSSDTDGRALLGRFQTKTTGIQSDDQEVKVEKIEEFEPGNHQSYKDMLNKIKECQSRVYFLYGSTVDAQKIFEDAQELNMTGKGYVWIVTEQALEARNVPLGTLGLQLQHATDEKKHIHDSLYILAQALLEVHAKENVTLAPNSCTKAGTVWHTGKILFEYIRKQILVSGKTGRVAFDEMGDRMFAEYKIINVQPSGNTNQRVEKTVGNYKYEKNESGQKDGMVLKLESEKIIWPGNLQKKPSGLMIPTHLQVMTINEKPFVYSRQIRPCKDEPCDPCNKEKGEIPCPIYNTTHQDENGKEEYCCYGYCIDLLVELSDKCNFTYNLHLSKNDYGALTRNNKTDKQEWSGLIGELVAEKADLIVAPLTINPERAQVMEFSKPFKYQGITILQKRQPRASQLVSFLQPFKSTLWVLVLVSVHVVAICLYLLDRFSPFGRFHTGPHASGFGYTGTPGANGEVDAMTVREAAAAAQKEESLNLTSAVWFAWGVLLNAGIGEGTPRSFSARVLGMVWAGFAMIIVASYTANLAAFLVLDKPQTSLTGINDPRLRNPMENFTYATVRHSSVDTYFQRQVELSNMYRTMEGKHFENPDDAIDAVKNDNLKAFIWDSSRLEYEAARSCHLITAGDLFGRSGYGVGLQKGSPWADKVTLAILDFHESGKMEQLDNKWILLQKEQNCDENDDNSPATLGLENMRGVFILVGGGIVLGLGLIIIEIIYKKHQMKKKNRQSMARVAIEKWRGRLEKKRTLAATKETKKRIKVNGMRMGSSGGGMPLISGHAGTPESITLSVDSLPQQRQMYPQGKQNQSLSSQNPNTSSHPTWKRSPIVDVTSDIPIRRNDPSLQYNTQQYIGYPHHEQPQRMQHVPNLKKATRQGQNASRPRSALSHPLNTVASREAGTLSAPDDDDEEWDTVVREEKQYHTLSKEKLISGTHSKSASHLKSLTQNKSLSEDATSQLNRSNISIGGGLSSMQNQSRESLNARNVCYHHDHYEHSPPNKVQKQRINRRDYDENSTYQDGEPDQQYNNATKKQKQYGKKGVHSSPLPTNNLPPHKQNKLYRKHMSSSSTPPLYSRSSQDSIVIVHPSKQRKFSNGSSIIDSDERKASIVESTDIPMNKDVKDDPLHKTDLISKSNEVQACDVRPHLISSTLGSSGAPPQFWADSSCHEDDPPSQYSGMNLNLSIASSTSGLQEENPTPPPVPPHGRPGMITSPMSTLPAESVQLQTGNMTTLSQEKYAKSGGYPLPLMKSVAGSREDEDGSSPDYTSLSTSSVDRMRQQIPQPPPPPKLYYQMRSNVPQSIVSTGSTSDGTQVGGKSSGGKQKQFKQKQGYYGQQQQQRPYHRAKEFVAGEHQVAYQDPRSNPYEPERHRSVQSQIGGSRHHPQNPKVNSSASAYKGVQHNSERYFIQATDGSRANIQQPLPGSSAARKRHPNVQNTAYYSHYMSEDNDL